MRVRQWIAAAFLALASSGCTGREPRPGGEAGTPPPLMGPGELQALPSHPPDHRLSYGKDSSQFGELRLPSGAGPHPVVVLIHGGCFKAAYATLRDLAPMGDALKAAGIATWNIEYRRVGQPGGGWPGTWLVVGSAVDQLPVLAREHPFDLNRVVIVGHSAGGHLAMWAAGRARVPAGSEIHSANPLPVRGVLNLAGPVDLSENIAGYEGLCRDTVVTGLMGGTPAQVPDRYAQASARPLIPLGVPQVLLMGEHEDFVPRSLAEAYARAATDAGDLVRVIVIPAVGHFDIASPVATTWPRVLSVINSLLEGQLPP